VTVPAPSGVEITGTLQREAWAARVPPPVELVRPSVWSVPVPIPNNPLRYMLCYVLEHSSGVVLVDPGWPSSASYEALKSGLRRTGHDITDVTGVLVTHAHQDHYGLACRVRDESGAWLAMNPLDAATQTHHGDDYDAIVRTRHEWLRRCGAPAEIVALHGGDVASVQQFAVPAGPDRDLADHERIRVGTLQLEAVWTPGHSRGHTVFLESTHDLLFAGDHLLPRITPSVATWAGPYEDALTDYLTSLGQRVPVRPATEVLPGHEYRFRGAGLRAAAIVEHHEARLREIRDRLEESGSTTVWQLAKRLTWSRSWGELNGFGLRSAVGETLSHLHCLARRGLASSWSVDDVSMWTAEARTDRASDLDQEDQHLLRRN
jgi:glyoxylase-like metal-dependent hydrolase (beta-lactamase superfamily II)